MSGDSPALTDEPAIYNWHSFRFLAGPSAFPSMLGSSCQDILARQASVLGQMLLVGGRECVHLRLSHLVFHSRCARGIPIMLLVDLHLPLVFRASGHFHYKIFISIYLSHHQSWSWIFLTRKYLSCVVNKIMIMGTSLILILFFSKKKEEMVTSPSDSNIDGIYEVT